MYGSESRSSFAFPQVEQDTTGDGIFDTTSRLEWEKPVQRAKTADSLLAGLGLAAALATLGGLEDVPARSQCKAKQLDFPRFSSRSHPFR